MLLFLLLTLFGLLDFSYARLGSTLPRSSPHVVKHGMFPDHHVRHSSRHVRKASVDRRQAADPTSCSPDSQISTKAPKTNIFAGLTDDEAAAVTTFLHGQESLNLTAAANATR